MLDGQQVFKMYIQGERSEKKTTKKCKVNDGVEYMKMEKLLNSLLKPNVKAQLHFQQDLTHHA